MKNRKNLRLSAFALGLISICCQVIFSRELLSYFNCNELVISTLMSVWIFTTAIGALIGQKFKKSQTAMFILIFQFIVAIYPLVLLWAIRTFKRYIFDTGTLIEFQSIFWFSFLSLLPLCFSIGLLFVLISSESESKSRKEIIKTYAFESAGSFIGGLLLSLIFLEIFDPFTIFIFLSVLGLLTMAVKAFKWQFTLSSCIVYLLSVVPLLLVFCDFEKQTIQKEHEGYEVVENINSSSGNIRLIRKDSQINVIADGFNIYSEKNDLIREELTHYPLIWCKKPEQILVISGAFSGITKELQKYKPHQIDFVDNDTLILHTARKTTDFFNSENINIIKSDPRIFIRKTSKKYDAVLICGQAPMTIRANRLFAIEFFREIKSILKDSGIVSCYLPASGEYMSQSEINANSILYNTVKQVFTNTVLFPAGSNIYVSSDSYISDDISDKLTENCDSNSYFNAYYLDPPGISSKSKKIVQNLNKLSEVNFDDKPNLYKSFMEINSDILDFKKDFIFYLLILSIILFLIFMKPYKAGVFAVGFTTTGLEYLLLLFFQISFGFIYKYIGMFFAFYMLGLFIGSYLISLQNKKGSKTQIGMIHLAIGIFSLIMPIIINWTNQLDNISILLIYAITMTIVAVMAGMQLSLSTFFSAKENKGTASEIYASDAIGAGIGMLIIPLFIIPELGMNLTAGLLGVLVLVMGLRTVLSKSSKVMTIDNKSENNTLTDFVD